MALTECQLEAQVSAAGDPSLRKGPQAEPEVPAPDRPCLDPSLCPPSSLPCPRTPGAGQHYMVSKAGFLSSASSRRWGTSRYLQGK